MSSTITFAEPIDVDCPFCLGRITVDTAGAPAIAHTAPACERYIEMEVVEFLQAVNRERGLQ